ncbi:MAG: HAD-IC family P-type ATPase, partial [Candidatus Phytoplasma australasiaticum]|nr:HAD-IC family P-type ATPase [Candidatus Phytoplasma australasiaticum]
LKTEVPIFFSRTTPKHKLKITEAYARNNEIVGVIGDGVNDILAMKAAHIGITMGKDTKDVVLNAADMILLDNNFSTIPKAVIESRAIYANIKKFISYVFCSNIPQIFPIIFMALFNPNSLPDPINLSNSISNQLDLTSFFILNPILLLFFS